MHNLAEKKDMYAHDHIEEAPRPSQGAPGHGQVVSFPPGERYAIYCDGVLHTTVNGTQGKAQNLAVSLSNQHSDHDWRVELC